MMIKTALVSVLALLCLMLIPAACRNKAPESAQLPLTTDRLVDELTFPDPARQIQAAESLKSMSAEEQRKVISTLEDMLKKETNPTRQAEIKSGLGRAKQAIGR